MLAVSSKEVARLSHFDTCFRQKQRNLEAALSTKVPSQKEIDAAWAATAQAYRHWMALKLAAERKRIRVREAQAQLDDRKLTLSWKASDRMIYRLRRRMGAKYNPEEKAPKVVPLKPRGSRKKTSGKPSSSATETSKMPPSSLESIQQLFETVSPAATDSVQSTPKMT